MLDLFAQQPREVPEPICIMCERVIPLPELLSRISSRFGHREQLYVSCPHCGESWLIEVGDDIVLLGDVDGFPGPCFLAGARVPAAGISTRRGAVVWKGKTYPIAER